MQKLSNSQVEEVPAPSKEEFTSWRNGVVGKWWFNYLERELLGEVEAFVLGGTVQQDSVEGTAIGSAQLQTKISLLYDLMNKPYEEIQEDMTEQDDGRDESFSNPFGE